VNFHIDNAFIHHEEESAIILTTPSKPKADHLVVQGPPVDQDNHVERFKQAHSDVEEEHGRLIAHEPNPYQTVHEALNDIISDNYVQKRCQDIKLVRSTAKPSN
jgi:tRNA nucleotidyltransferase (CCA-adding enzyme)